MLRIGGGVGCAVCAALVLLASPLAAQDAVLTEAYGQGVHSFFSGRYADAYSDLSSAVSGGSKDPRVYYFRGLAASKLGRDSQAESDMKMGARLETEDVEQLYPVGRAMERVQGRARLALERHRMVARAESRERQEKLNALRFEQQRRSDEAVRREPVATPDTASQPPAKPPVEAKGDDPFGAPPAKSGGAEPAAGDAAAGDGADPFAEGPATPEKKSDDEGEMPAGDAVPPAKAAGEDDAFGSDAGGEDAKPAGDAKAGDDAKPDDAKADEGAGGGDMPAGDAGKAEDGADPFGDASDSPPAKAAPKKAPEAPKAKADAEDPFGDSADQSPPKKAAPATKSAPKAAEVENPFGE